MGFAEFGAVGNSPCGASGLGAAAVATGVSDLAAGCANTDATGSAEGADAASLPHREMLVNLGLEVPAGFERYERMIDIVSDEANDRQVGRSRWRHYADRGYTIQPHDFAKSS